MAACWRELAGRADADVFVLAFPRSAGKYSPFATDLMHGIPSRLLDEQERADYTLIRTIVQEQAPDVLFVSGWQHKLYFRLALDRKLDVRKRFMIIDAPERRNMRQRIAQLVMPTLLRNIDGVFVPGERSWQYARSLGFEPKRIHRGTYGVDWTGRAGSIDARESGGDWPKSFLFAGQYVPRKGIDLLLDAYARYRAAVPDPWPLHLAGAGPSAPQGTRAGVHDHGFLQPDAMRELQSRAGVFVLPSRADAWPLAVVEACAAGLPVICTEACGSHVELLRPYHNGLVVPTADAQAITDAMLHMHRNHKRLPEMGRASRELAAAYSTERWAERILAACTK